MKGQSQDSNPGLSDSRVHVLAHEGEQVWGLHHSPLTSSSSPGGLDMVPQKGFAACKLGGRALSGSFSALLNPFMIQNKAQCLVACWNHLGHFKIFFCPELTFRNSGLMGLECNLGTRIPKGSPKQCWCTARVETHWPLR